MLSQYQLGDHLPGPGAPSEPPGPKSPASTDRVLPLPGSEPGQASGREVLRVPLRRRQLGAVHQLPRGLRKVRTLARRLRPCPGDLRAGDLQQVHDPGLRGQEVRAVQDQDEQRIGGGIGTEEAFGLPIQPTWVRIWLLAVNPRMKLLW